MSQDQTQESTQLTPESNASASQEVEPSHPSTNTGLPLLPETVISRDTLAEDEQRLRDLELTQKELLLLDSQIKHWIREVQPDAVKHFIQRNNLQNDFTAQMIAQRVVRTWCEIQGIDKLLDKWGISETFTGEDGYANVRVRNLLEQRTKLEVSLRSYIDQLGLAPKMRRKLELEAQKIKLKEKLRRDKKAENNKDTVDFAKIINITKDD